MSLQRILDLNKNNWPELIKQTHTDKKKGLNLLLSTYQPNEYWKFHFGFFWVDNTLYI